MKAWEQLSPRGQILRLRQMAVSALSAYHLTICRLRGVGSFTNLALRADAADGSTWMVRVANPRWRSDDDIRAEMDWLQALAQSDIGAPVPLFTADGEAFVTVRHHAGGTCRVSVQSWLPGILLEKTLTSQNLEKMGQLFARLHQFSASFQPPPGFNARRMSHYLARGETDCLFMEENHRCFSNADLAVFQQVRDQVLAVFHSRYADPEGLRVIHNDLWHGNIKLHRGKLHPFDFEDTLWGYPVQDIAMAMQDLWKETAPGAYEPLLDAFRRGYESLSPWPERFAGEMEHFRAGRMLWVANYVAAFENEHLADFLPKTAAIFRRFLSEGKLRRSSE